MLFLKFLRSLAYQVTTAFTQRTGNSMSFWRLLRTKGFNEGRDRSFGLCSYVSEFASRGNPLGNRLRRHLVNKDLAFNRSADAPGSRQDD